MLKKRYNEDLIEYQKRLSKNKRKLSLTWKDISVLIKKEFNIDMHPEFIRKECYLERKRNTNQVNNTRILCISDNHCPYNLPPSVVAKYEGKVDILIFNGDEQDCQSISKFSKRYRENFVDELVLTRKMIMEFIETIAPKKVIFNYGNHNERLIRYFSDKISDDLLELVPKTNLDFLIDNGFYRYNHKDDTKEFIEPIKNIYKDIEIKYTGSWFTQIGKTIFVHPMDYKSGILGTTEKAWTHFHQRGLDFDCIVMAHTHQIGYTKYANTHLFESGAMCKAQNYTQGRLIKPQSNGYLYLIQDKNGNLNFNDSKIEIL